MNDPSSPQDGLDEQSLADDGESRHGRVGYGRFGKLTPIGLGLLILVVVAGGWWAENKRSTNGDTTSSTEVQLRRDPAPEFTLKLLDGTQLNSRDLAGKVTVLNFWASWCEPCRNESPILQKFWEDEQAAGRDTMVVGVGVRTDRQSDAEKFVEEFGLTYPIGRDTLTEVPGTGPIEQAFGIPAAYPSTVFIGPDGNVTRFHLGPITESQLRYAVNEARGS